MRLHWGQPQNPTKLRAYTGALCAKEGDNHLLSFTDHHIARWYGVSFGVRGFIGLQTFSETLYPREHGPIPGSPPHED